MKRPTPKTLLITIVRDKPYMTLILQQGKLIMKIPDVLMLANDIDSTEWDQVWESAEEMMLLDEKSPVTITLLRGDDPNYKLH